MNENEILEQWRREQNDHGNDNDNGLLWWTALLFLAVVFLLASPAIFGG